MLFKNGEVEKANAAKAQTATLKEQIKSLQEQQTKINQDLQDLLVQIPNIPHDLVPMEKALKTMRLFLKKARFLS